MSKTSKLLRQMKQREPALNMIASDMVIPNHSGVPIKSEIRIINPSLVPWISMAQATFEKDLYVEGDTLLKDTTVTGKLTIDQNTNDNSINIDSEATTANIIEIDNPELTTGKAIALTNLNKLVTGRAISIYTLAPTASNRHLIYIYNAHGLSSGTIPLSIRQQSEGQAIFIDQNGNGNSINIDSEATTATTIEIGDPKTTTGYVINVGNANNLTSGRIMRLHSNSSDNSARDLIKFINDNTAATGTKVLTLQQDAAQTGLLIDQNGATGTAIEIDQDCNSASDIYSVKIINDNAGAGLPGGIDMSSFSANEPLFNLPVDTTAAGAYYGRMAVYVTGVGIKYIHLYNA